MGGREAIGGMGTRRSDETRYHNHRLYSGTGVEITLSAVLYIKRYIRAKLLRSETCGMPQEAPLPPLAPTWHSQPLPVLSATYAEVWTSVR